MSFELPPSNQGDIPLHPQVSHQKKRKRTEEEKPDEVAQKKLSPSEIEEGQRPTKKSKREIQKIGHLKKEASRVTNDIGRQALQKAWDETYQDEEVDMSFSEPVSRKRKADQEEGPRKKQKAGLSDDEAFMQSLSEKQNSTDPDIIIDSLKSLYEKRLHSTQNPQARALFQSFLTNFRQQSSPDQCKKLNELLILMYPTVKDYAIKEQIKNLVRSFTFFGRCHDLVKNLKFLQEYTSKSPEIIINALFEGPRNKLTLDQKIQALSFANENKLHIDDVYWLSVIIPKRLGENDLKLQTHIQQIPERERAALIRDTLPLFRESMSADEMVGLLEVINTIPQTQRALFIQYTLPLLRDTMSGHSVVYLLKTIKDIPQEKRFDAIQDSIPLLNQAMTGNDIAHIMTLMATIPRIERSYVIQDVKLLLRDSMKGHEVVELLVTTKQLPEEGRSQLIQDIKPLLRDTFTTDQIVQILRIAAGIPHPERASVIADIMPLLRHIKNADEIAELVHLASTIPHIQRTSVAADITPLLRNNMNGREIIDLSIIMATIPEIERPYVLRATQTLLSSTMSTRDILQHLIDTCAPDKNFIATTRDEIKEKPQQPLDRLMKNLDTKTFVNRISTKFIGEEGVDQGGLSRDFVSLLFSSLAEKMPFKEYHNGLFRPELPPGKSLDPVEEKTYQDIGRLLMFILNASDSYPIGMIFDTGVYAAIQSFPNELLDRDFATVTENISNKDFETMFAIYKKLN